MVAAGPLAHRGPAELAAPQDQGVVEHPPPFQILDERGGGLIDVFRGRFHSSGDVAVVVPGPVIKLDESDSTLGQASGQQAVRGEAAVSGMFDSVEVEDLFGFGTEVGQFGDRGLHLEGQLILADPGLDLGVDPVFGEHPVEPVDLLDHLALGTLADAFGVPDVMDGFAFGLELDSLESAGQATGRPLAAETGCSPVFPRDIRTMKPGRSLVSAPRP